MGVLKKLLSIVVCLTIFCTMGVLSAEAVNTRFYISGDTHGGDYALISVMANKLKVTLSDSKNDIISNSRYTTDNKSGVVLKNSKVTLNANVNVGYNAVESSNDVNKNDLTGIKTIGGSIKGGNFIYSSRISIADNNSLYLINKEKEGRVSLDDDNLSPRGTILSNRTKGFPLIYSSNNYTTLEEKKISIGSAKSYYICYEAVFAKYPQNPCRYYFSVDTVDNAKEQEEIYTGSSIENKSYAEGFKGKNNVKCTVNKEMNFLVYCQSKVATLVDYTVDYRYSEKGASTAESSWVSVASVTDASPTGDGYLKTYGITFTKVGRYKVEIKMSRAASVGSGKLSFCNITVDVVENENDTIDMSLTFDEQKRVDDLNRERQADVTNGIWSGMYVVFAICGILVLIYSLLIIITYYIDILNSFTSVSLLNKITFGSMYPVASKDESVDVDTKRTHIVSHKDIWIAFAFGVMSATIMFNARGFILLIVSAFKWLTSLFGG